MNKPITKNTFKKYITSGLFARDARENSLAITMAYEKLIEEDIRIMKEMYTVSINKKTK